MKKRIVTACIASIVGALIVCTSHISVAFRCVIALLSLMCVNEAIQFSSTKRKVVPICIVLGVCLFSAVKVPHYDNILAPVYIITTFVFVLLIVMNEMEQPPENRRGWMQILTAVISVLFLHSAIYLRESSFGLYYLILALVSAISTDTFAFVFGKVYGKHKLAPRTSPKKTIEGAVGGLISSVLVIIIAATLLQRFTDVAIDGKNLIIYSVLSSVLAAIGDLSFSLVKRSMGIKDFENLLPGHGGILDRFDSILFTLPLFYILVSSGVAIFR